jgi:hypothetical protein
VSGAVRWVNVRSFFLSTLYVKESECDYYLTSFHQGLQVQDYFGNFCKRVPTDIDLPAVST